VDLQVTALGIHSPNLSPSPRHKRKLPAPAGDQPVPTSRYRNADPGRASPSLLHLFPGIPSHPGAPIPLSPRAGPRFSPSCSLSLTPPDSPGLPPAGSSPVAKNPSPESVNLTLKNSSNRMAKLVHGFLHVETENGSFQTRYWDLYTVPHPSKVQNIPKMRPRYRDFHEKHQKKRLIRNQTGHTIRCGM
jgi:hypothetical protein